MNDETNVPAATDEQIERWSHYEEMFQPVVLSLIARIRQQEKQKAEMQDVINRLVEGQLILQQKEREKVCALTAERDAARRDNTPLENHVETADTAALELASMVGITYDRLTTFAEPCADMQRIVKKVRDQLATLTAERDVAINALTKINDRNLEPTEDDDIRYGSIGTATLRSIAYVALTRIAELAQESKL